MSKFYQDESLPLIACDLTAIEVDYRDEHLLTIQQLLAMVQEVRDLPDGYALRLPNNTQTFLQAAQYIAHERKCCSFFHFVLEVEPEGGPVWLHLRGKDGVKAFLQGELGTLERK